MPFVRYGCGGAHAHAAGPHADHGARHGGHLLMLGGHHVEIVTREGKVELYLSDSWRRPIRPASCSVRFDTRAAAACTWQSYRSVAAKPAGASRGWYEISIDEGTPIVFAFP
jgi:hypothetical protein